MSDRQRTIRIRASKLIVAAAMLVALLQAFTPVRAVSAANAAIVAKATEAAPSKLERQVTEWVAALSKQKPFKAWQGTDPQIEALGPGTHSWLVLFSKEGKDIGYMVVHAVTDGTFQLGEYGTGPFSLFSKTILRRSLVDSGLATAEQLPGIVAVKHYVHPFAAAWEVTIGDETYWLDAKTAEELPLDGKTWRLLFSEDKPSYRAPTTTGAKVSALKLNDSFDVYEKLPWLTGETPFNAKDAALLRKRLEGGKHLRYVTEPFGDAMLYAVPIIGYQRWSNGRMDLAIDMEGNRFIPIGAMLDQGFFYR
ncbi:hypothetical protein ACFPPD_01055 [Cohnella suwonensis]|uniref:Uncharacterized protein n=1 Tax=Cohnella suwonensis TaxID=696072 RepID=A0ABW0LRT2_9BACL